MTVLRFSEKCLEFPKFSAIFVPKTTKMSLVVLILFTPKTVYIRFVGTHNEYDAIIKPIIYHGLLAALQLFKDGNTRYARTIQHVELWGMLNNIVSDHIDLPLIYATRQYFPFRGEYRDLIKNLAVNQEDAWDDWISFNILIIFSSCNNFIYLSCFNILRCWISFYTTTNIIINFYFIELISFYIRQSY